MSIPPSSLTGLKIGEFVAYWCVTEGIAGRISPPSAKVLAALRALPPMTARGFFDELNANKFKELHKEFLKVTGLALAGYMEQHGLSTNDTSLSAPTWFHPEDPRTANDPLIALILCIFSWPRSRSHALTRVMAPHAANLFGGPGPAHPEMHKLGRLGKIHGVSTHTASDGSPMWGPGVAAAILQATGNGGAAVEDLDKGCNIDDAFVMFDGAGWNTESKKAWATSKELRAGELLEKIQFEAGNEVLAEVMTLLAGECFIIPCIIPTLPDRLAEFYSRLTV